MKSNCVSDERWLPNEFVPPPTHTHNDPVEPCCRFSVLLGLKLDHESDFTPDLV